MALVSALKIKLILNLQTLTFKVLMKSKKTDNNKSQARFWLDLLSIGALLAASASSIQAQTFDSGSDGTNGALNLTLAESDGDGVILFDPEARGLVPDANNAYHFTTIDVEAGVTVRLRADIIGINNPVIWLASGDVAIDGILDLNGESGKGRASPAEPAIPGAGGFEGGVGRSEFTAPSSGQGPGGGSVATVSSWGGAGAGHFTSGAGGGGVTGGSSYGNNFLIPLIGGSGGAGGGEPFPAGVGSSGSSWGFGGGAGGGAILIASSTQIQVNGSILCNGGNGASDFTTSLRRGGGGSGGSIRLLANTLTGSGNLSANGGSAANGAGNGSRGPIRIEVFDNQFAGTISFISIISVPISVFPKSGPIPSVRVVRISGLAVPPNDAVSIDLPLAPTGSFSPADVLIEETGDVTFEIEASDIPIGTVINLTLYNGTEGEINISSTPLAGTKANSTATATTTIPSGFSRFTIEANWDP